MLRQFHRCFHSSTILASSSKSDLALLRKKTGYTFANCKKALELNSNDVVKAESWLKEQARALGWSKATKLEGRATAQGLLGLALKKNCGVMVEVNCETDFVARNKTFKSLVEMVTASCLQQLPVVQDQQDIRQLSFDTAELRALEGSDGKSLGDHAVLAISTLGENITLRRALCVSSSPSMFVTGYTHPAPNSYTAKVMTGKYAALVAYLTDSDDQESHQLARQLCQHVVGMNPSKVGEIGTDEPTESQDDETVMIHQDFLLEPSTTVGELLAGSGLRLFDFWRYECGQVIQPREESAEPTVASQTA